MHLIRAYFYLKLINLACDARVKCNGSYARELLDGAVYVLTHRFLRRRSEQQPAETA
jgi:hypothetical protein